MQMTESEIVRSYKQAEKKTAQIRILAELNACDKKTIRDILEKHGCEVPHYKNRYSKPEQDEEPIRQNEEPVLPNEVPESVVSIVKERMGQIDQMIAPLATRIEELSSEYSVLNSWLTKNT